MYTKEDLEQAIEHCENKVKELKCGECKEEHKKLLEMLMDLKNKREGINNESLNVNKA